MTSNTFSRLRGRPRSPSICIAPPPPPPEIWPPDPVPFDVQLNFGSLAAPGVNPLWTTQVTTHRILDNWHWLGTTRIYQQTVTINWERILLGPLWTVSNSGYFWGIFWSCWYTFTLPHPGIPSHHTVYTWDLMNPSGFTDRNHWIF
jgi:hypothetical protein